MRASAALHPEQRPLWWLSSPSSSESPTSHRLLESQPRRFQKDLCPFGFCNDGEAEADKGGSGGGICVCLLLRPQPLLFFVGGSEAACERRAHPGVLSGRGGHQRLTHSPGLRPPLSVLNPYSRKRAPTTTRLNIIVSVLQWSPKALRQGRLPQRLHFAHFSAVK